MWGPHSAVALRAVAVVREIEQKTTSTPGGGVATAEASGEYSWCGSFSEGLAAIRPIGSDQYGFIDKVGTHVIPAVYDQAGMFADGLAPVVLHGDDDEAAYIDTAGHVKIKLKSAKRIEEFVHGLAIVGGSDWSACIDTTGKEIWRSSAPAIPKGVTLEKVLIPSGPARPLIKSHPIDIDSLRMRSACISESDEHEKPDKERSLPPGRSTTGLCGDRDGRLSGRAQVLAPRVFCSDRRRPPISRRVCMW